MVYIPLVFVDWSLPHLLIYDRSGGAPRRLANWQLGELKVSSSLQTRCRLPPEEMRDHVASLRGVVDVTSREESLVYKVEAHYLNYQLAQHTQSSANVLSRTNSRTHTRMRTPAICSLSYLHSLSQGQGSNLFSSQVSDVDLNRAAENEDLLSCLLYTSGDMCTIKCFCLLSCKCVLVSIALVNMNMDAARDQCRMQLTRLPGCAA